VLLLLFSFVTASRPPSLSRDVNSWIVWMNGKGLMLWIEMMDDEKRLGSDKR